MRHRLLIILFFLLIGGFLTYLEWGSAFVDPDSFYHAKMALLTKQEGLFTSFPWIRYAPFTQNFTNQHLLYHLFLAGFMLFLSPLAAIKIAAVLLALTIFISFYLLLRNYHLRWPFLYTVLLLTVPIFVFRIHLAKAGPLAILLLLAGLYLIWEKKYAALMLLSFLYVWTHGGWILILLLAGCAVLAEWLLQITQQPLARWQDIFKKIDYKILLSVTAGLILGLILNPYFPQNLQFYWEQVAQIGLKNYQNEIIVGSEWYPLPISDLIANLSLILILALLAWFSFFKCLRDRCQLAATPAQLTKNFHKLITLFLFSGLLGALTLKSTRFIEYFTPFFILAHAFLLDFSLANDFSWRRFLGLLWQKNWRNKILICYLPLVGIIILISQLVQPTYQPARQFSWRYLEKASQWLKQNTPSQSLIFHSNWSDFPMLFFHNHHNAYLAGLDPTFFYRYDKKLYREWIKINNGKITKGLGEKISHDFGADYILVKKTDKTLQEAIDKAVGLELKYQDDEANIYFIKPL